MTTLSACQATAMSRASHRRQFAYFLDMGLGKTLLALSEAWVLHLRHEIDVLVVLCPNTFKSGWLDEIKKHNFPVDAFLYTSANYAGAKLWVDTAVKSTLRVLIMNDEALRSPNAIDVINGLIKGGKAGLIFDESIRLKNPMSAVAKNVMTIVFGDKLRPLREYGRRAIKTVRFRHIRVMTGKPQTQGPQDLWLQLLLAGARVPGYKDFVALFCIKGGWMGKDIVGVQNVEQLKELIDSCSFIAHKKDWLSHNPAKLYTRRRYQLGPVLQAEYDRMEEEFLAWVKDQGELTSVMVTTAVTKYIKLAQLQAGFIITEAGDPLPLVAVEDNPRIQVLAEILGEAAGKVVICYRHRYVGAMLASLLPGAAQIGGGMDAPAIQTQVQRFNTLDSCRYMLLQIQTGKYGLTLLGDQTTLHSRCSTMIFYENTYSLDDRSQIEDRIHRIGQLAEDCLYVDLAGSEMDDRIVQALQRKTGLYEAVMGHERVSA